MNNPSTCPHFSLCSGCTLGENFFEPIIWKEALSFFQKWDIHPKLNINGFSQTRLKAKLAMRPGPAIGLFKKNSHDVLNIPECVVHHPSINQGVSFIRQGMIDLKIPIYEEKTREGLVRYVQLSVERSSGLVQLVIVVNANQTSQIIDHLCQNLSQYDIWHSIWLNFQPEASNTIFGKKWLHIGGEPFLWQTINETPFAFHPGAFSQAHLSLFNQMVKKIEEWVKPEEKVLELYAGVGSIGLTLHRKTNHIHLVENNPFASLSFEETQKRLQFKAIFHCIDAKDADLSDAELIIVDPPRKGLDPLLLKKLCHLENRRLVYVSCGFESFKRDCKQLIEAGWRLKEANGYLLFPGTNHVEILAFFETG